jgi:hypothetical protein
MRKGRLAVLAAAIVLALCRTLSADPAQLAAPSTGPTGEPQVPKDPDAFTQYIAAAFRARMPEWDVTVLSTFNIRLTRDTNGIFPEKRDYFIKSLFEVCTKESERCADDVAILTADIAEGVNPLPKPDPAKLWAVVIPEGEYAVIGKNAWDRHVPVGRSLGGDLWVLCMLDRDRPHTVLYEDELGDLGLSKEAAVSRCLANTLAQLPQDFTDSIQDLKPNGTGTLTAPYEGVLFLAHDNWAPLAQRFDGELLVAVPEPGIVVYARGVSGETAATLAARAEGLSSRARDVPPPSVFRWTKEGWDVVAADASAAAAASHVPLDDTAFALYFADALAKRLPEDRVEKDGHLVLQVTRPSGAHTTLNVRPVFDECMRERSLCDRFIDSYVGSAVRLLTPPEPANVQIGLVWYSSPGKRPWGFGWGPLNWGMRSVERSAFADFAERCFKHPPKYDVNMTAFDREDLDLSEDAALALCENNARRTLPALAADTRVLSADGAGRIEGANMSAWLLFAGDWASLVPRLGGDLIVAVPTSDIILFSRGGSQEAIDALASRAEAEYLKVEPPARLCRDVFRWSPGGWSKLTDLPPE